MNLTKKAMSILARATDRVSEQDISTSSDEADRLIDEGITDNTFKLTDVGKQVQTKIVARLEELKSGVPFADRKINEPELVKFEGTWKHGLMLKTRYITNGVLWTFGNGFKDNMPVTALPNEQIKPIATLIRKHANVVKPMKGIEVFPNVWKVLGNLDEHDLIIFADKDGSELITIDAVYYDFVMFRYPTARFYVHIGEHKPLVAKIERKTLDGVIAVIAPAEIL